MDFREEYFESKLKHVGEEMTLISKQLMLIQDFIVFEFGSKFKNFCESRRTGRFHGNPNEFDTRQTPTINNSSNSTVKGFSNNNAIGIGRSESDVPLMVENFVVNQNESGDVTRSGCSIIPIRNINSRRPQASFMRNSGYFGSSRKLTKSANRSNLNLSNYMSSDEVHPQSKVVITPSTFVPPSEIQVECTPAVFEENESVIDEPEREHVISVDPLDLDSGGTEDDSNTGVSCDVVFVKHEGIKEEPAVQVVSEEETEDNDTTQPFNFLEGYGFAGNGSAEPCTSSSKSHQNPNSGQPGFEMSISSNSPPESSILIEERQSLMINHPLAAKKKPVRMTELFGNVPWQQFYQEISRGKIQCTFRNCSAVVSNVHKFKRHFLRHTGIKPYKCHHQNCNAAYTRKDQLEIHLTKHLAGTVVNTRQSY